MRSEWNGLYKDLLLHFIHRGTLPTTDHHGDRPDVHPAQVRLHDDLQVPQVLQVRQTLPAGHRDHLDDRTGDFDSRVEILRVVVLRTPVLVDHRIAEVFLVLLAAGSWDLVNTVAVVVGIGCCCCGGPRPYLRACVRFSPSLMACAVVVGRCVRIDPWFTVVN